MARVKWSLALVVLASVLVLGVASPVGLLDRAPGSASAQTTSVLQPDPVVQWNEVMTQTVAASPVFLQTRAATMMHLAIFEAVNALLGGYRPYLGTVSAPPGASPEAAAIAAAHRTLVGLYPGSVSTLDVARASQLAALPDGQAKTDGIKVGEAAAAAILALRADDGAASANSVLYTPGTEPGDWRPTPPGFAQAAFVGWGQVTTFGVRSGSKFRSH